ncbi:MAG: YifB family Mg chelatase-like AAA ATPase [Bacteroidia bacterium]
MLVKLSAYTIQGIEARTIEIEVHVTKGVNFYLVGLPDNAVKESQQRIYSAISESGFKIPGKQCTINLAPANLRKEGTAFDLGIALGILAASNQIETQFLNRWAVLGELALDGRIRSVTGVLPMAIQAKQDGLQGIIIPHVNAHEAAVVEGLEIIAVHTLKDAVTVLNGHSSTAFTPCVDSPPFDCNVNTLDFADIKGQQIVKRALEIAAAGGHNVLLIGPPGAGKTMISKRLPGILPPLSRAESLETTRIYSVAGKLPQPITGLVKERPFRSPHHTISNIALVGGGNHPQPGEISLAHNGVLFLDELPEFQRSALEVLRQPMEERCVQISRARYSINYPANIMLIASMNPCPCGYYSHPEKHCSCNPAMVHRYLHKISGPLLDRIDLQIEVMPVQLHELEAKTKTESSSVIRKRVIQARNLQAQRFNNIPNVYCNAQMHEQLTEQYATLQAPAAALLKKAMTRLGLSARAYSRILKMSRTIADLENAEHILTHHVAEAIQYRTLDRTAWHAN